MNRIRRALSLGLLASTAFFSFGAAQAQNRELIVASSATYAPFAFENKDKQIVGFDIDIINAIAKQQGLKIKIVNTPFTGIFGALNNGDVDLVISGVTINEKRKQSYDFTPPYFAARQLIALPKNSTVASLKDLRARRSPWSAPPPPTTSPRASSARPAPTSAASRARRSSFPSWPAAASMPPWATTASSLIAWRRTPT